MISGSGSNLQAIIDAVENGSIPNAKVALVISNREGAYGLERARKHSIPNKVISNKDAAILLKTLETREINGIVLAGYLSILPPEIVKAYNNRIINIHPALLPMFGGKGFYGIRVHQAVLASGVKYTGATSHLVDDGVDTGAALIRGVIPVHDEDTAESLQKRVLEIEHKILTQTVKALVEDKIKDLSEKPKIILNSIDREGALVFAKGLLELGRALTETDNGD